MHWQGSREILKLSAQKKKNEKQSEVLLICVMSELQSEALNFEMLNIRTYASRHIEPMQSQDIPRLLRLLAMFYFPCKFHQILVTYCITVPMFANATLRTWRILAKHFGRSPNNYRVPWYVMSSMETEPCYSGSHPCKQQQEASYRFLTSLFAK